MIITYRYHTPFVKINRLVYDKIGRFLSEYDSYVNRYGKVEVIERKNEKVLFKL